MSVANEVEQAISGQDGGMTADRQKAAYWKSQVEAAKKREEDWRKESKKIIELYEVKKAKENSFNILYSNTETLLPAIYSSLPRAVVQRRFKDEDPLGLACSHSLQRILQFLLNQPDSEYAAYDDLFQSSCLSALLPGRGVIRFKYDPEFSSLPTEDGAAQEGGDYEAEDDDKELDDDDGVSQPIESNELQSEPAPDKQVVYESICGVAQTYDEVILGPAKRWKDVPFIAFEYSMTRADVTDNFGADIAARVSFTPPQDDDGAPKPDAKDEEKVCCVWEIWHKAKKQVVFVSPGYPEGFLKDAMEDPLKLGGFYPIPRPLSFTLKEGNLIPTPLYKFYEEQAKELNRVTQRINKIISALKVRGFYDGQLKELATLMQSDDNTLMAAESAAALIQGGGLDKLIWMMPLDKLITVLQQLYVQRQQVKDVIYEITGISDILRGASVASETATAQQIKNQWGTLRLKRLQREMARYIRDCLGIMAEIACQQFSEETFAKMTGLQYPTTEEKAKAQALVAQLQAQVSSMQAMQPPMMPPAGQAPGGPPAGGPPQGQPPAPPPNPQLQQLQQQLQQAQQVAQQFSWGDILGVLRDDLSRNFRIEVETNSTVDIDATEDQKHITDLLTAVGQMFQNLGPVVEQGVIPLGVLKQLMLVVIRRYQFGDEIEDQLLKMSEQLPQKGPDPKVQAAQLAMQQSSQEHDAKMAELQAKQSADQQKAALDQQSAQLDLQLKQEEINLKKQLLQIKQQEAMLKLKAKQQELALASQATQTKVQGDIAVTQAKVQGAQAMQDQALQHADQSHQQQIEHAEAAAVVKQKQMAAQPKTNGKGA